MSSTVDPPPDVVLFDLGGVLVRLGGAAMGDLVASVGADFWPRWLGCRWVRAFERGECSSDEFAAGVVADWGLEVSPDVFLAAVHSWPTGLEEGALDLVAEVRRVATVGCLSNTNELHWADQFTEWGLDRAFDVAFASHLMGVLKPDRAVFERVVAELGVDASGVLFLDDNLLNVEGARDIGMAAEHVRGVEEARAALVSRDVLGARS